MKSVENSAVSFVRTSPISQQIMNRARRFSLEFFSPFCDLPAPNPQLVASIIIPARDETSNICATLDALRAQRDLNGEPLGTDNFEIILLANNCRDATAQCARDWAARHSHVALHVVEIEWDKTRACVGLARRALMNAACFRLQTLAPSHSPRAICSTDADTRVSPFWLAHTLEELRRGADAVGGRILLSREGSDAATRRVYLLDTAYRLLGARLESALDPQICDPWPRHFQFFGASLAIRPEIYARIGGLPEVRCLEDMSLEAELVRRDCCVRHSPHVVALTSARRDGRVETGLSTQLQEWAESESVWQVPSGEEIAARARLKRRLRAQFDALGAPKDVGFLAQDLGVAAEELQQQLERATHFGELWLVVERHLDMRWKPVAVEVALAQLRAMLVGYSEK